MLISSIFVSIGPLCSCRLVPLPQANIFVHQLLHVTNTSKRTNAGISMGSCTDLSKVAISENNNGTISDPAMIFGLLARFSGFF